MSIIANEKIENMIFCIRGQNVMLSPYLAKIYGVEVRALVQSVKRNKGRFPYDFMFQLNEEEYDNLKSHFVISSWGGSRRALPYAFTEQGVAMLSSVLKSRSAIEVNIRIIRAFVYLRQAASVHKELVFSISKLEHLVGKHDEKIRKIFAIIEKLINLPELPQRNKIGFKLG